MNKIAIIGVYFGELPKYFPLWLESAYKNRNIDFFVFTDQIVSSKKSNVHFVNLNIDQFEILASKKLGIHAQIKKPYKCCDFKPTYGIIFSDYVSDYDYWGHCDFDLLFGDLERFFENYKLHNYDKFLPLGHLSLYRNTDEVNNRYKNAGAAVSYEKALQSDQNYYFDELAGVSAIYLKNNYSMFCGRIFADISPIYKRYKFSEYYYLDSQVKNYKYQTFCWDNGKILHLYVINNKIHKAEYAYIHFQKRPNFPLPEGILDSKKFYITNQGFIIQENETISAIKRLNPYPGIALEQIEHAKFIARTKYNGLIRRINGILR